LEQNLFSKWQNFANGEEFYEGVILEEHPAGKKTRKNFLEHPKGNPGTTSGRTSSRRKTAGVYLNTFWSKNSAYR